MQKLIFFDTETTGADPKTDRIIQFAAKCNPPIDPDEPDFIDVNFYKPPMPISIGAMATHHFTNADAERWGEFSDRDRESLNKFFADGVAVAHNAQFDVQIMKNEGVEIPVVIDTLKIAKRLLDIESYSLQFLRYYFEIYENYIHRQTGVAVPPHDARTDVFILEKIFAKLIELVPGAAGEMAPVAWMIEVTKNPLLLRKISFGKHKGMIFSEVPKSYLAWLDGQPDLDADLRFTIDHHLGRLPLN